MLIRMPNWFQPSGTPYRPGTFSSTGLTVANPGNGYDTSAGVVDTSTSSTASTTGANTTGTQTYSAAPSHAAVTGVLNVRIKIDINAFNGTVQGPNGTASVFYSTDGSTPSLAFDQTSSWNAASGTFDVLLTKTLTVDPSTIKVLVSENGAKGGNVVLGTDFLTTVTATLYDIVFITP